MLSMFNQGRGQNGPASRSRATDVGDIQMPASQGYVGTGGDQFRPQTYTAFEHKGPSIGTAGPHSTWIGSQFAPGQGGPTPGGGGFGVGMGSDVPVQTLWVSDGNVIPQALQHQPGHVGWVGSRRGAA